MSSRLTTNKKHSAWIRGVLFIFLSATAGLGIGLGWQNDTFFWLGICGFAIFLAVQLQCRSFFSCFLLALATGYCAYLVANPWMMWTVGNVMGLSYTNSAAIAHSIHLVHGGIYCLFAIGWWAARKFIRSGWILAPAIWLICEAVYPALFSMRQGCLLLGIEPLVQITSVFGVPAATLQLFAIASLLPLILCWLLPSSSEISVSTARQFVVGILLLTAVNFCWGTYRIQQFENQAELFTGERLNVAIIQGDTEYAQFHLKLMQRSRQHVPDCELVLWPECSLGKYNRDLTEFADATKVAMNAFGMGYRFQPLPDPHCYLLAAGYSWTRQPGQRKFNSKYVSAYLLDPQEEMIGRHDKIELMPGGEYVPGEKWFPWLANLGEEDDPEAVPLSRGTEAKPIGSVNQSSIGVMLCCEDMYPSISRDMTNRGADVLVCLANGMCFDSEIVLRQHFAISRFRAIENNRYFLRCGSFGVSAMVAPTGKVVESLPCFAESDLKVAIPVEDRPLTLFNRYGDTLTWGSYLLLIGFTFNSLFRRSSNQASQKPVQPSSDAELNLP